MGERGLLFQTLKKTVKHSLVYGIGMSFTAIASIVLVPLYTRFLAPSDYGIYSLIAIIFSLLLFLYDFGMVSAIFRWYYQYAPHEIALRRRVISTALIFLFTLACVLTVILWSGASFISRIIFGSASFTHLIRLMLAGIFLQSLTWVPLSLLRIKEKVFTVTSVIVLGMVLVISTNFVLLSMGRGLNGIYEAYIITYMCITIALFPMMRRDYSDDFSVKELKGMLKFGLPYMPVLFFSWVIDFSDRYLLARLSSLEQVGLYSVGYRIGQAMYLVVKTFIVAWVPLMLSLSQEYREKAQEILGKIFTYFFFALAALFLFVSIFSKEIIQIFTSHAYYDAAKVVPWISFSYVLNGVYLYMLSGLIIARNIYIQPVILLISAAVNILLNIILIPRFGMMGSAGATVISYLIVAVATYCCAQKLYPIPVEWGRITKITVSVAVVYFLGAMVGVRDILFSMLIKGILVVVFFYLLYAAGFFQKKELHELKLMVLRKNA